MSYESERKEIMCGKINIAGCNEQSQVFMNFHEFSEIGIAL